jgi:hypothetical protein
MQLSPFTRVHEELLRNSILKYLHKLPIYTAELRTQYRMHFEIAHLVNHLRYSGNLRYGYRKFNPFVSDIKAFSKNPVMMLTHNSP